MAMEFNSNIHVELFHTYEEWVRVWADDPDGNPLYDDCLTSYHIYDVQLKKVNLRDDVWYWLIGDRLFETLKYV